MALGDALNAAKETGDQAAAASASFNIALAFAAIGDRDRVITFAEDVLRLSRGVHSPLAEAAHGLLTACRNQS